MQEHDCSTGEVTRRDLTDDERQALDARQVIPDPAERVAQVRAELVAAGLPNLADLLFGPV